jgi:hypothetical protein
VDRDFGGQVVSKWRVTFYATHRKNPGETPFLKVANILKVAKGGSLAALATLPKREEDQRL